MRKPFAITFDVGSSRANRTGAWRTERPVYVHNLPPCNSACPAGENIQQWLYDAEEGPAKYEAAWRQIMQDNPFPAVMGRVCYRPCETACDRAQLDSAVGINSVERFLGDEALRQGWQVPVDAAPTGKRVLVVGAGPSGLSAAYHLARMGHSVTIKDAGAAAGGMMRYGIPKYRLPRDILDAEISRILDMGITLELDATVTDIQAELEAGYDAAFVAAGAHIGRRAYTPAGASARIMDAVSVLHGMEDGAPSAASARPKPSWCTAGPGEDAGPRHRGRGGAGGRRHHALAVHRRPGRGGQAGDREDEARRDRIPAADRGVRRARGGLPGAGPRPERRPVGPAERARRDLLRQRGRGRPRPDDRAPGHLRRRRHGAVGATGSYEIDYDYCKGCGLCVAECPPGAIEMEPEPS